MRYILLLGISLLMPVAQAQTAAENQALAVFERFLDGFTQANQSAVTGLFAEDVMFWGTGSKTLVELPEGVQAYFRGLGNNAPGEVVASALSLATRSLGDDAAMVSGMWQVGPASGAATPLRVSLVVARVNGRWQIVQFHNSRVPD